MNNEIQEKFFQLLLEVKDICEKNKIDYYLTDNLLFDDLKNEKITKNYHEYSIRIKAVDADKFIKLASKKNNRVVEGLFNNGNFPGNFLRYVATDTLYFYVNDYKKYKNHGFSIKIELLNYLPNNKLKSKYISFLQIGLLGVNAKNKLSYKKKICAIWFHFLGLFGNSRRGKYIFKLINNTKFNESNKKNLYYRISTKKINKYAINYFEMSKNVNLNGISFKVPSNYILNGSEIIPDKTYNFSYIIDQTLPYKEFFEIANKNHFVDKYSKKREKLIKANKKINPYRIYVRKCWDILYRTRDRFELWEYYKPLKPQIISLYQEKKYEDLEQILDKYLEKLNFYYNKNLGIIFDSVIFDITIDLLIYQGKLNYARKLIDLVPKEHKISLDNMVIK